MIKTFSTQPNEVTLIIEVVFEKLNNMCTNSDPTTSTPSDSLENSLISNESSSQLISESTLEFSIDITKDKYEELAKILQSKNRNNIMSILLKQYSDMELIGEGTYGKVFKGTRIFDSKKVALKIVPVINIEGSMDFNEGTKSILFSHKYSIKVYEMFTLFDVFCIVMEYMELGSMKEAIIQKKIVLSNSMILQCIYQLCVALHYFNQQKRGIVVHRDIKPLNILIRKFDPSRDQIEVVLADFGGSTVISESLTSLSLTGTDMYLAPEILSSNENLLPYSIKSDIFAIGVSIYQLLTFNMKARCAKTSIEEIKNSLTLTKRDDSIIDLVCKMLEKDPLSRPTYETILFNPLIVQNSNVEETFIAERERRAIIAMDCKNYKESFVLLFEIFTTHRKFDFNSMQNLIHLMAHYSDKKDMKLLLDRCQYEMDNNNGNATFLLGVMFENGYGVKKNFGNAIKYYLESDTPWALNKLGNMYERGSGVKKDEDKAFEYYQKSAKLGFHEAQLNVAYFYKNGCGSVVKNDDSARYWYEKSASNGNMTAMCDMGRIYLMGIGEEKDTEMAFKCFSRSASGGNINANAWLGIMYEEGLYVSCDLEKACHYYEKAADGGIQSAISKIRQLADRGEKSAKIAVKKYSGFFTKLLSQ